MNCGRKATRTSQRCWSSGGWYDRLYQCAQAKPTSNPAARDNKRITDYYQPPPPSTGALTPRTSIARVRMTRASWMCWRLIFRADRARRAILFFMENILFWVEITSYQDNTSPQASNRLQNKEKSAFAKADFRVKNLRVQSTQRKKKNDF